MLYYLFQYLEKLNVTGASVFQFLSFRAAIAVVLSLVITILFGKGLIRRLHSLQMKESIRDLGLAGQLSKAGTPTMGGLIIAAAIVIPTILLTPLKNPYILLALIATVWMAVIGFIDDYIKVFKKDKKGLPGKVKIIGQVGLGIVIGSVMFFSDDIVIRQQISPEQTAELAGEVRRFTVNENQHEQVMVEYNAPVTNLPFLKNYKFDYAKVLTFLGEGYEKWAWLVYIPVIIFIITAVSNAANLSDGIDGLAASSSAIIGLGLLVFAYVSGNKILADYLNVMYLPTSGELVVFTAAFVGACVGFLWYNAFPAQVFMGDTGSLMLGSVIACLAILVRKELLLPLLCGIFVIENLSVIIQVSYFKYSKKKYGEGRRVFLMAPIHHHYQKKGIHESKIVSRFMIVGIMLLVITFATLKLR